jgi:hypothetical protein
MLHALGPDFDPNDMCLTFETANGQANPTLSDPNKTPIKIPVYIVAPYFQAYPEQGNAVFRTREEYPVDERDTIESLLSGFFPSLVRDGPSSFAQKVMPSVLNHESPRHSVVLMNTYRGRFLVIPRQTTFKAIFAGARWPRDDGPLAFEDLRKAPRARDFEQDGVELGFGWYVEIFVIPNDKLEQL